MSMTVTATRSGTVYPSGLYVAVVTGAAISASQPGRTAFATASAGALSITPIDTGSLVFGAQLQSSPGGVTFTPNASTTYLGNAYVTGTQNYTLGTFVSSSLTTSGTPVSLGNTNFPSNNFTTLCEIIANGSIAIDGSSPAFVAGPSNSPTTASFTPPGGSLLVAMLANAGFTNWGISDSSGLTWTLQAHDDSIDCGIIWTADVPSPPANQPGKVTLSQAVQGFVTNSQAAHAVSTQQQVQGFVSLSQEIQ